MLNCCYAWFFVRRRPTPAFRRALTSSQKLPDQSRGKRHTCKSVHFIMTGRNFNSKSALKIELSYLVFQLGVSKRSSSMWTVQRPVSNYMYTYVEIQQVYIQ